MIDLATPGVIKAIREGDATTFQQVFDACYESLCGYAFTIVKDMDEAEDIAQSIFVKLWEQRETLDIQHSIRSYLFRSVYNKCINQLEHISVKRKHELVIKQSTAWEHPEVFPNELEDNLKRAINTLPPQCRTIFLMSRYEELKHQEIAEKLNISVNTIQNQICKALKILRTELKL